MKIAVASKNPVKVEAVREALHLYSSLATAEIVSLDVSSQVSSQPYSIDETIRGAINRAKQAHAFSPDYYLSVGIESGFHNFPFAGLMELSVCSIYDGKKHHFGFSPAFKCPEEVQVLIEQNKLNLNDACYRAGYTNNPEIGASEGMIGILTQGRKTRKDYTRDAVIMALIHVDK